MSEDSYISKIFFGVYPADAEVDCRRPGLYILNTDISSNPGTHWVLILVVDNCDGYIFDSLGFTGEYTERIVRAVHGRAFVVTKMALQADNTQMCGGYTLYFARKLAEGCNVDSALLPFTQNHVANDCFIQNYLWRVFGVFLSLSAD